MDTDNFSYIIDGIRFSYSSVSTFGTCPYAWRLTYIDGKSREPNFYSDYGLLIHDCFERYFLDEVDYYSVAEYFINNFDTFVVTPPPTYPPGMLERYRDAGIKFFSEFAFDKKDYEIIDVESVIDFELAEGIRFTGRPDLVLREKESGKNILFDYKSSSVFRTNKFGVETVDNKKISDYHRQMFLYTRALREGKGINIDEITLWFTRPDRQVTIPWSKKKEAEAVKWAVREIEKIKTAVDFPYDNSNKYFCDNLCGVRSHCVYRK